MTYPPGGQPPYGEPQRPEQPFGEQQPSYGQPQQPFGYPPQGGQPYAPQGQGFPPQGGPGYPPPGGQYPPPGGQYPQQGYPAPNYSQPGQQPPKKGRTGLIVGLLVLMLVIAGAIATGVVLTVQGKTPLASDEKRIEVAVRDFYDTLSTDGFTAAAAKQCAADRTEYDALPPSQKADIESAKFSVKIDKVDNIVITGDRATAHITGALTMTLPGETPSTDDGTDEHLKKEDGTWKVCSAETSKN